MFQLWIIFVCVFIELAVGDHGQENCFIVQGTNCSNVTYYLYTSKDPHGLQINEYKPSSDRPLKVLIHDFGGSYNTSPNTEVRPELLRHSDIDVISVDFAKLVAEPCYKEAVVNIKLVGLCIAHFLNAGWTKETHLIGHGLGAHVAGLTAQNLLRSNKRIQRISGLNPSKTLFLTNNLDERLDAGDANFVDVIHTDIFMLGLLQPIGHVDFYPNMGTVQPKCGPIKDLNSNQCYHKRAAEYYAESVETTVGFLGFVCKDVYSFIANECQPSKNVSFLGYRTDPKARGSYFLATKEQSPYARGNDFTNLDRSLRGKTFLSDAVIEKLEKTDSAQIREVLNKL